jgi:hypothetical protein
MTQMSKIQQVNSAIMFGEFSNTELDSIISAVQYAREQLRKTKIRAFKAGDAVKFTSAKRGGLAVTGTVTKVAIKYVTVKDGVMLWKVPANMLEAA